MISSMTDDEAEDAAIVENLHRKDVAPLEEAEAYARLIEKGKDDIDSLAVKFGKNKVYIKGRLQLLNLIADFRDLLDTENINLGVAGVLANYEKNCNKIFLITTLGRIVHHMFYGAIIVHQSCKNVLMMDIRQNWRVILLIKRNVEAVSLILQHFHYLLVRIVLGSVLKGSV